MHQRHLRQEVAHLIQRMDAFQNIHQRRNLVEQILDACGYTSQKDLAHIRVLDPACGSGNFLVGAAQRLAASGKRVQLSQEELALLVQRNIWGFDPERGCASDAASQKLFILREGGVSSTSRPFGSITDASEYWITRFRG